MAMERNGVERLLAGDAEAFEDFYEAFFARIYRFAERRTAARAEAERLCGAIFEDVLASLSAAPRGDAGEAGAEREAFARWVIGRAMAVASRRAPVRATAATATPDASRAGAFAD